VNVSDFCVEKEKDETRKSRTCVSRTYYRLSFSRCRHTLEAQRSLYPLKLPPESYDLAEYGEPGSLLPECILLPNGSERVTYEVVNR
jgi:hypothetical protein